MSLDNKEVVFVLGGPGSGKGTNCEQLAEKFGFKHLSAGDLLRAERNASDSEVGKMIAEYIKEGKIVPKEVTIGLLAKAMKESDAKLFLIDGFPRAMDQCEAFENDVVKAKFCLFFDCPENVLEERLLKRGETSGRTDDNIESIRKRFKTYMEVTMPVIEYFDKSDRVRKIDSSRSKEEVLADAIKLFE
eukprot:TRINITY_DN350_c0_g1_i2.p1 TRINITY_DN350_c0_g1~~TRINITY_DN350_c0_g1_i2.p1  ORF type:complete len:218 (+),score=60.82 TRINITY_DN350_c0_g1_i2:88-654(+)